MNEKQKNEGWIDSFYNHTRSHLIQDFTILSRYNFEGNERILDVGCGNGKATVEILKLVPSGSIVGVDRSPSAIKLASASYPPEKFPNLKFIQIKAKDMKFEQEFDLAISINYLNWIGFQSAALQKINKALKTNGVLLGMFYNSSQGFSDSLEIIKASSQWKAHFQDYKSPIHVFAPAYYRQLLLDANFEPVFFKCSNISTLFDTKEDFKKNLLQWLPHAYHVPKELQDKFLNNLIDIFTQVVPLQPNGQIKSEFVKLEFKVNKKSDI